MFDPPTPICVTTDASGAYTISALPPLRYTLGASADAFIPALWGSSADHDLALGAGEHKTKIDIALRSGGVTLEGTVSDVTAGPIAKARVSVVAAGMGGFDWPIAEAETDSAGHFIVWVAAGPQRVNASAHGYVRRIFTITAPAAIAIQLTPGSSLAGTVVDGTGRGVVGARVAARMVDGYGAATGAVETDDGGRFKVEGLTPGRYAVEARAERGFATSAGSVLVGVAQDVDGIALRLTPAFRVAGRIVLATTKEECSGATIELMNKETHRFEGGEPAQEGLVVGGLQPGTYEALPRCPGFAVGDVPDIVISDRDVGGLIWQVAPGATIRGRVRTPDGVPITRGAVISIAIGSGRQYSQLTTALDPDGSYALVGLAAGKQQVFPTRDEAQFSGVRDHGIVVEVAAGQVVERDLTIADVGTIVGTVVDTEGQPQRNVPVTGSDTLPQGVTTDAAGHFRLDAPAGEYLLTLAFPVPVEIQRVKVVANELVAVTFVTQPRRGTITGTVVDADGHSVPDAYVYASSVGFQGGAWAGVHEPSEFLVLTSGSGAFTLTGLAEPMYSVHAFRMGGGRADVDRIAVGSATTLRMHASASASLEGVVKHRSGSPVVDLAVAIGNRRERFVGTGGVFALDGLRADRTRIHVSADGEQTNTDVTLVEGETTRLDVELSGDIILTGRVVELHTQRPVAGVQVNAVLLGGSGYGRQSFTDAMGHFAIARVPAGTLSLSGWTRQGGGFAMLRNVQGVGTVDLGDVAFVQTLAWDAAGDRGFECNCQYSPSSGPSERPAEVTRIDPDGPAAHSGLRVGDVIISIDGYDVRGVEHAYLTAMLLAPAGTAVMLGLARGVTVAITLAPGKH